MHVDRQIDSYNITYEHGYNHMYDYNCNYIYYYSFLLTECIIKYEKFESLKMDRSIIPKYRIKNKKQNVEKKKQNFSKYIINNIEKHEKEQSQVCQKE